MLDVTDIRRRFLVSMNHQFIIPMRTIFCKGTETVDVEPEPAKLRATAKAIHDRPELFNSLAWTERNAIERMLGIEPKSPHDWINAQDEERVHVLHNQYGHLS